MSATPFPLLKLPWLALGMVLDKLDIRNLIDLSMMSSKFKKTLELHKVSVKVFHITLGALHTCLSIDKNMDIEAYYPMDPMEQFQWVIRRINGEDVMNQVTNTASSTWCERLLKAKNRSFAAKEKLLESIVSHLLSFLNVKEFQVTCRREMNFSKMFFWKFTKTLETLEVTPLDHQKITVSSEDLKFLLEEVMTPKIRLNVFCPGMKYSTPLKHQEFRIDNSSWVDFKEISIGPGTTEAYFGIIEKIEETDINRLFKEWAEGKNENLKNLIFRWGATLLATTNDIEEFKKINMEKVLEGLEMEQTEFTEDQLDRRGVHYYRRRGFYRVVRCKIDGILGAICGVEKYAELALVIWKEKEMQQKDREREERFEMERSQRMERMQNMNR